MGKINSLGFSLYSNWIQWWPGHLQIAFRLLVIGFELENNDIDIDRALLGCRFESWNKRIEADILFFHFRFEWDK